MNREDELQGIIDFQTEEIKKLREQAKKRNELLEVCKYRLTTGRCPGKYDDETVVEKLEQVLKGT